MFSPSAYKKAGLLTDRTNSPSQNPSTPPSRAPTYFGYTYPPTSTPTYICYHSHFYLNLTHLVNYHPQDF